MRCGDSPCKCQECGAGVGTPRIVTPGTRVPCAGPALDGGRIGRRGKSIARMLRSRHATIPEGVGRAGYERQKKGGGARASPPHKTLSGFAICTHYTRSEPVVDQPGGEFHGRLCGESGRVTESTALASSVRGRRRADASSASAVPPVMRLWRSRSVAICWSRGFLMREEYYRFENPASRRAIVSSLGAGLATWSLVPGPLMTAAEWARAWRLSRTPRLTL